MQHNLKRRQQQIEQRGVALFRQMAQRAGERRRHRDGHVPRGTLVIARQRGRRQIERGRQRGELLLPVIQLRLPVPLHVFPLLPGGVLQVIHRRRRGRLLLIQRQQALIQQAHRLFIRQNMVQHQHQRDVALRGLHQRQPVERAVQHIERLGQEPFGVLLQRVAPRRLVDGRRPVLVGAHQRFVRQILLRHPLLQP